MSGNFDISSENKTTDPKEVSDFATIQLKIGDNEDLLDPVPPNHIVSFTYENTVKTEADKVTIELFDSTWTTIEELIISAQNSFQFRFGWTFGRKSAWRKTIITKHVPTFEIAGLRLSIEGFDESISANNEARTRDWSDYKYIHEIVRAIADSHQWTYDEDSIVETTKILDEEGTTKVFLQQQMPDLTFIKDYLLKYAQTLDGSGGFNCWYDSEVNKIFFRPPKLADSVKKAYIVHRDRMGQVLSFSPDLGDGALQRSIGALNTRMLGIDPFKRELYDVVVDSRSSTDGKILNGQYIPDQKITSVGGAGRFMRFPALTSDTASDVTRQRWFDRFNMFFIADMEVIGDPELKPGTNINILVLDSNNQPHYCSGKFYIESATHTINGGSFMTTLKLWKNGLRFGSLDAKKLEYGQVRDDAEYIEAYFNEFIKPYEDLPYFYQPPVPIIFSR